MKPTRCEIHQEKVFCVDLSGSRRKTFAYMSQTCKPTSCKTHQEEVLCIDLSGSFKRTLAYVR